MNCDYVAFEGIDGSGKSSIIEQLSKILDKKGHHARAAISVNSLPLGVAVEIDGIFEVNLN